MVSYKRFLHIIAFDIPLPADYGGAIDVFYKIKALHDQGIGVILHCFQYGQRQPQSALAHFCHEVHYYKRQTSWRQHLHKQPYIAVSRRISALLSRLQADTHPILFEGLHTCGFIDHPSLANRVKIVRMHNVEWEYYQQLADLESKLWKKAYFNLESAKLKRYEASILPHAQHVLAISPDDMAYFERFYGASQIHYVPPFHQNNRVESLTGRGQYALFPANLTIADNVKAALFLIDHVFAPERIPFYVAGKGAPAVLVAKMAQYPFMALYSSPTDLEMQALMQQAHCHVLYSFQKSGMKLKLLNALFNGRFCIGNAAILEQTGLEHLCMRADDALSLRRVVRTVWEQPFSLEERLVRAGFLEQYFSNEKNAAQIIAILT